MCGIAGIAFSNHEAGALRARVQAMVDRQVHRGPDDEGHAHEPGMAFGFRRLAIRALANGTQPIRAPDSGLVLMCNGEIYNSDSLRTKLERLGHHFVNESDVEVLLHLYEERELDFLEEVEGMFALALWDPARERLVLARDRFGIKPLYYTTHGPEVVFASELQALLADPATPRTLDPKQLNLYLELGFVPSPGTPLAGVFKLEPATIHFFESGRQEVRTYWQLPTPRPDSLSVAEAAARLAPVLQHAVESHLVSEVPVAVFLSGGLDSSTLASAIAEQGHELSAFTIGFEEPQFDESQHALRVGEHLGIGVERNLFSIDAIPDLIPEALGFLDEPLADAAYFPTYLLSQAARQNYGVALAGEGGDEIFAGYPTYEALSVSRLYDWVPGLLSRLLIDPMWKLLPTGKGNWSLSFIARKFLKGCQYARDQRAIRWLESFDGPGRRKLLQPDLLVPGDPVGDLIDQTLATYSAQDWLSRALFLDTRLYLADNLLHKVDRASMAHSLEVRVPFLDHKLVECVATMPSPLKRRFRTGKRVLKEHMKNALPADIVHRTKRGFGVPIASWLREHTEALLGERLSPTHLADGGLFQPDYVSQILDEHCTGRIDHRRELWSLFTLQDWIDRHGIACP